MAVVPIYLALLSHELFSLHPRYNPLTNGLLLTRQLAGMAATENQRKVDSRLGRICEGDSQVNTGS